MSKKRTSSPQSGSQISLFGLRETPDAFRKAVQVIHSKPQSPLSLVQRKLGNAWLKNAIERSPNDDGWWEIGLTTLAHDIGFDSNNRQYLKESAESLMRIVFEWDVMAPANKRVHWKASVLFPEIEIRSDVIRYQISSQMRERLIDPEIYAMIDMTIVRRFRRAPSLAIWEFCVRFEKIGRTAQVPWEQFRDMMLGDAPEGKTYREYKYFKSKVLLPAIAEINAESNHTVVLQEEKEGRRITTLQFQISKKTSEPPPVEDGRSMEMVGEMVKLGLPQSEAKKIATTHRSGDLRAALEYTKKRLADKKLTSVENPGAYFRHALANHYALAEVAPSAATSAPGKSSKRIDIKEAYFAKQLVEARAYFNELDPIDQAAFIDRYNEQQNAPPLRLKSRVTKLAQTAFFQWLAMETWGEPTSDALLAFAQHELMERPTQ